MSTPAAAPAQTAAERIGRIGIWSGELRFGDPGAAGEAAAELDALGYGALWMPGGNGGDILPAVKRLLDATRRTTIATGILNIWRHQPSELGIWWRELSPGDQARTLLGLGISHGPMIGADYKRPVATMSAYLDRLADEGIPADRLCIAALGPKMLELAAARTAGAHPYLAPAEHAAFARQRIGGALLAPEVGVICETDPAKARAVGREALGIYLALPNYVNNWRRFGFSEAETADPSDRLVDALFAWGDPERIAAGVRAHLDAGADHACIQVVRGAIRDAVNLPMDAWRTLAKALL